MRIVIFGMGYVGLVSAACLSRDGHRVTGVDISAGKVSQVNAGQTPIVEPGVTELIAAARASEMLDAVNDPSSALLEADLCIVCVGTPSEPSGAVNIKAVEAVIRQIGAHIRARGRALPVVVRSTVPVGTMAGMLAPLFRELVGSAQGGKDCELIYHPEFLREGSAVGDYYDPPKIVIGEARPSSPQGDCLLSLYAGFKVPVFRVDYAAAELVKYCDNVFHGLKIAFANEVGLLARAHDVDSRSLMEIFCSDRKLNISEKYLRPGFAFGGSCLPKDLRGLLAMARGVNIDLPVISSVLTSNKAIIELAAQEILASGMRKIGMWGLAFKPFTDDLRESPLVRLAEMLLGKGVELTIVDGSVDQARLIGGNQAYVASHLPHLDRLLSNDAKALDRCQLVVVGHPAETELVERWLSCGIELYDLAGVSPRPRHPAYKSIT